MEKEITIDYQPDVTTLVRVTQYLLSQMPFVKFFPFLMLFLLFQEKIIGLITGTVQVEDSENFTESNGFKILIVLFIWTILYFIFVRSTKNKILENKKALEKQLISFNTMSFIQKAETFTNEISWQDVYQIKETKSWFLIYTNKTSALPIVKADLNEHQYADLKALFNSLSIKKSLK